MMYYRKSKTAMDSTQQAVPGFNPGCFPASATDKQIFICSSLQKRMLHN